MDQSGQLWLELGEEMERMLFFFFYYDLLQENIIYQNQVPTCKNFSKQFNTLLQMMSPDIFTSVPFYCILFMLAVT